MSSYDYTRWYLRSPSSGITPFDPEDYMLGSVAPNDANYGNTIMTLSEVEPSGLTEASVAVSTIALDTFWPCAALVARWATGALPATTIPNGTKAIFYFGAKSTMNKTVEPNGSVQLGLRVQHWRPSTESHIGFPFLDHGNNTQDPGYFWKFGDLWSSPRWANMYSINANIGGQGWEVQAGDKFILEVWAVSYQEEETSYTCTVYHNGMVNNETGSATIGNNWSGSGVASFFQIDFDISAPSSPTSPTTEEGCLYAAY